jgi:hypothetical protein
VADEGKTQAVRVADVLLIGPLMILVGARCGPKLARRGLVAAGAATIVYNARNLAKHRKKRRGP